MYNRPARLTVIYGNQVIGPMTITTATIGYPVYGYRPRTRGIYGHPAIGVIAAAFTAFTMVTGELA